MDSQRVQFVDGLVLVGPLQVKLDLSDQRKTVGVGYVQFLHFINAIFLQKRRKWGSKHDTASDVTFPPAACVTCFFYNRLKR